MRLFFVCFIFSFALNANSQASYETTCSNNIYAETVCETSETPFGQLRRQNSTWGFNPANDLNDTTEAMRRQRMEDEKRQLQNQADYSCILSGAKGFNSITGQCFGGVVQQNSTEAIKETGEMLIDSAIDNATNGLNAKELSQQQRFSLKKCMKSNIQTTPYKVAADNQIHMSYLLGAKGDKDLIKRIGPPRWHEKVIEVDMYCRSILKISYVDRSKHQYR